MPRPSLPDTHLPISPVPLLQSQISAGSTGSRGSRGAGGRGPRRFVQRLFLLSSSGPSRSLGPPQYSLWAGSPEVGPVRSLNSLWGKKGWGSYQQDAGDVAQVFVSWQNLGSSLDLIKRVRAVPFCRLPLKGRSGGARGKGADSAHLPFLQFLQPHPAFRVGSIAVTRR